MHQKAVERDTKLKEEVTNLDAKLRLRERQLLTKNLKRA